MKLEKNIMIGGVAAILGTGVGAITTRLISNKKRKAYNESFKKAVEETVEEAITKKDRQNEEIMIKNLLNRMNNLINY